MISDKHIRMKMKELYKGSNALLVEELAIPKRICLADLVLMERDGLSGMHGYEIKSEIDSLTRLEGQVEHYSRVFSRCTLIVAEKHEEKALAVIPEWWGVIVVARIGFDEYGEALDDAILLEVREAQENPSSRKPYSLLQLLWRSELMELIERHSLDVDKKLRKRPLREKIAKLIPSEQLEQDTVRFLLEREDWKVPGVESAYMKKRKEERTKRAERRKKRKRYVRPTK